MFNYYRQEEQESCFSGQTGRPSSLASSSLAPDSNLSNLLWILAVQRNHETKDLAFVRKQEQEFDTKSKACVGAIFLNSTFQRWIMNNNADLILIEGRFERHFGKTSPISYFCAHLVYKLSEQQPPTTLTLHFFCGQHVAASQDLRGPRGLMRSLISQFLRVWPRVSLDNWVPSGFSGNNESISMESLCHLFKFVTKQIPPHYTLLCIIDDITQLERDEWKTDYRAIMRMLEAMVKSTDTWLRFKVLITSPGRSKWLKGDLEVNALHRVLVNSSNLPVSR